jgi:hypothetical protein
VIRILGTIGVATDWKPEYSSEHLALRLARKARAGFVGRVVIIAPVSGPPPPDALPLALRRQALISPAHSTVHQAT